MRPWLVSAVLLALLAVPNCSSAQYTLHDLLYPPAQGPTEDDRMLALFKCYLANPDQYRERFANPVAMSNAEMSSTVRQFTKLNAFCRYWQATEDAAGSPRNEALRQAIDELEYLTGCLVTIAQVRWGPGHSLEAIDLATNDDPALVYLRTKLQLPQQKGLVLFHTYPSVAALPDEFKPCFSEPSTRAVTLLCRYIIAIDDISLATSPAIRWQSLRRHRSHELAHAYVNCVVGYGHLDSLPTWFNEGLALRASRTDTDAYFTGQGLGGDQALSTGVTKDYKEYASVFRFAEGRLGKPAYYGMLKECCVTASTGPFFAALRVQNYQELRERCKAERWKRRLMLWGPIIGILLLWLFFPFDKLGRRRPPPAVTTPLPSPPAWPPIR